MNEENTISNEGAIERPRSWWVLNGSAKAEKVEHERFHWVAVYADGELLEQYEAHENPDDGTYHRFSEIQFDKLAEIHVWDTERPEFLYVMRIKPTQQPFMIYRVRDTYDLGSDHGDKQTIRFAVVGWKDREDGSKVYTYIMPDGAIIVANDDIKIA